MIKAVFLWIYTKHKNYDVGLALLNHFSRNKLLVRHLSRKDTPSNRVKLTRALKKILAANTPVKRTPVALSIQPKAAAVQKIKEPDKKQPDKQTLQAVEKLEVTLSKMYNKKGILSNSLRSFSKNDNTGRRAILSQINGLNSDMNEIRSKLNFFELNGLLPPIEATKPDKYKTIPDEPLQMKQTLLNLRTSVSKISKKLRDENISTEYYKKLSNSLQQKLNLIQEIEKKLNGKFNS